MRVQWEGGLGMRPAVSDKMNWNSVEARGQLRGSVLSFHPRTGSGSPSHPTCFTRS